MKLPPRAPRPAVLVVLLLAAVVVAFATAAAEVHPPPAHRSAPRLDSAARTCTSCHTLPAGGLPDSLRFLERRAHLSQQAWADSARLATTCGACHAVPAPDVLPTERWPEAIAYMDQVRYYLQRPSAPTTSAPADYADWAQAHRKENLDILHYFLQFSDDYDTLPPDPARTESRFTPTTIGLPAEGGTPPRIGNVNVVDLDRDGRLDVVASDFNRSRITWIFRDGDTWRERSLARLPFVGRTEVVDVDGDGTLDVAAAVLGTDIPSDEKTGGVALLMGQADMQFAGRWILRDVGRVADVRPGDFDGDGDVDFVVAVFGWIREGALGWLEQQDDLSFVYHRIVRKAGGVHVIPTDLNGDGALDFVALLAQEHEEVTAFLNDGRGGFTPHVLFKADAPTFGSSGIELADLDGDGDQDVLYTNGDAVDLSSTMIRPYHGVQWLENQGDLTFAYHPLLRLYGAYRAVAADLDGDGDLDVVASSLVNDGDDPARMSLVWLENDGRQRFTSHGIADAPTHLITADVADMDGDGLPDIVTGSMHFEPPFDRLGRVTLWRNTASGGPSAQ